MDCRPRHKITILFADKDMEVIRSGRAHSMRETKFHMFRLGGRDNLYIYTCTYPGAYRETQKGGGEF